MPPAKRASTSTAKSKSSPKSKTSKAASGSSAAKSKTGKAAAPKAAGAKAPGAKAAGANAAGPAAAGAKAAPKAAKSTPARSSRSARAIKADGGVISIAERLATGSVAPRDVVMLTHEHIQETLDDAASRGRMTRKDANELAAELVRRGRTGGADVRSEIEDLLSKSRQQIGSATKRAVRSEPVDRIVRGADRARRAAGVGSSFPITGYPDLNVSQVQARLKELSKPELRKVLSYERKNANRKSVVGAIERSL